MTAKVKIADTLNKDMGLLHQPAEAIASQMFFFNAKTQHENLGDAIISRELITLLSQKGRIYILEGGMPASFLAKIRIDKGERFRSSTLFIFHLFKKSYLKTNK